MSEFDDIGIGQPTYPSLTVDHRHIRLKLLIPNECIAECLLRVE